MDFNPHTPHLMQQFCALALKAGASIMAYRAGTIMAETKADSSVVTQADRDAEAILAEGLRKLLPDIQIIGEEGYAQNVPYALDDTFFLLDPLDGTRGFVNKGKDFTVNIGLIHHHIPLAGVIYAPVHETLYISSQEGCAYKAHIAPDGDISTVSFEKITTRALSEKGLRIIASQSHRATETDAMIDKLHVEHIFATSSSLKFGLLAEGKADLYPRHGATMEWDTAAGQAIVTSAGGIVTTIDGKVLSYGKLTQGLKNPYFIAAGQKNWHKLKKNHM